MCYLAVSDYLTILNDRDNVVAQGLPSVLDDDVTTCQDLPVQGQTPPTFWIRMNTTLLKVNQSNFALTIKGQGISCKRHDPPTSISVIHPSRHEAILKKDLRLLFS
jgi:hypothetical protein